MASKRRNPLKTLTGDPTKYGYSNKQATYLHLLFQLVLLSIASSTSSTCQNSTSH